jgi:hypothetical protein
MLKPSFYGQVEERRLEIFFPLISWESTILALLKSVDAVMIEKRR